jgi:hypothetical protein
MPRVLGSRPQLQKRFWALLQVAQRHAVLREHQARQLTAGWPLLRRCALRLGELLHADGVIDRAEDVFFLTRTDLDAHAPGRMWSTGAGLSGAAATPARPLTIGRHPGCWPRNSWRPWTPCAPPAGYPRTPSSASRPVPDGRPVRSASSMGPMTSITSNPVRCWSLGPPLRPGRRWLPTRLRWSPTAAPPAPSTPPLIDAGPTSGRLLTGPIVAEHGKYWTGTGQLTPNINRHGCLKHHYLQGR